VLPRAAVGLGAIACGTACAQIWGFRDQDGTSGSGGPASSHSYAHGSPSGSGESLEPGCPSPPSSFSHDPACGGVQENGALGAVETSGASAATSGSPERGGPSCPDGGSTTIRGTVYDPSFQDPLYNITVYVPKSATLPTFPSGASCNTCSAFFPEITASAVTDADGHFVIQNAPSGANIPLVVQTGKWRKEYMLANVTLCADNPQPDKSLRLPKNAHGDGDLPDIAISTGREDSLECLLVRIGVDADEYVGGGGGPGHIHIFHGNGATTSPAAPESFTSLWDSTADLMKNDVLLLSCEGEETPNITAQNQQSLVEYSGAGGRVFASHYHYAWFNTGPFAAANLATWAPGGNTVNDAVANAGDVITTLANGMAFPEGAALKQWLGLVNALTNGQLPIWFARHNADVGAPNQPPSQPWIVLDPTVPAPYSNATMYFSFDTPIGKSPACGHVVYSDLDIGGGAGVTQTGNLYFAPDYPGFMNAANVGVVPAGCAMHPLTPQEKVLEFMIFDQSSCLVPIGQAPGQPVATIPPR
jgi:hypothetical protein